MTWTKRSDDETVLGLLRAAVEDCPDRVLLDIDGTPHTYADVWRQTEAMARAFLEAGVQPGDTVGVMLDNNEDSVAAWFGANAVGAIWVGINTALRGDFLRHVLNDSGARIVLCEADFVGRFTALDSDAGAVALLLVRQATPCDANPTGMSVLSLDECLVNGAALDVRESAADDCSLLVYTSGTTGPSKGCIIAHGYVMNLCRRYIEQTARTADEVNWSPLPTYHFNILGQTVASTLLLRGTAAVAPRFSVSGFWPEVQRSGARVVNLLGSMGTLIAQMNDTPEMQSCFGQIRVVHGAPFSGELQQLWHDRFGVEQVGGGVYGLTEAVPVTTLRYGTPSPPGSSGRRNSDDFDVRIFDEHDVEVQPGAIGEIVCRPTRPNVMFSGYWRRPDATVSATRNLWFHTGDFARFDEDGFLHFVDRSSDYLRRRGENIASSEVEATFLSHSEIKEVAVHAVASELTEDDVKVTAVLEPGSELTAEELFEWSIDRLPYFALPRYIEFRVELPVSAVGRVLKYQLRDEGCTASTWDREIAGASWEKR